MLSSTTPCSTRLLSPEVIAMRSRIACLQRSLRMGAARYQTEKSLRHENHPHFNRPRREATALVQNQKRSLGTPFSTYFLFIVRSRNSCINDPIRSTSSSNAKWPVSRRWSFGDFLLRSREHFYRATCHADPGLSARPFARAGKAPHHDR